MDAALAAGVFGQQVSIVFWGDGVASLFADLEPPEGQRHIGKQIASAPLYDISDIFFDHSRADGPFIDDANLSLQPLDTAGLKQLLRQADHVMSF
ncbi:conserved hypothetical protein [Luminiphilus syltensis NOR5-1B]|uniref:Uncharacterized protein n=2 Tax=Luminiphilus TaxID=1341118 RepID=B8KQT0_9GAMM|nr:conserved hypothetical protein [Luminiphilus syltensis NOR5-1B]